MKTEKGVHPMRIAENLNEQAFLDAVSRCEGEVLFSTTEGDRINLKSRLCQYVFALIYRNKELMAQAQVVCERESDNALLREYLNPESDV